MAEETIRSRIKKTFSGQMPSDRLPLMEWAWWWDLTIKRWEEEGMPHGMSELHIKQYFGLDGDHHLLFPQFTPDAPPAPAYGEPWIKNENDYENLLPYLYPDPIPIDRSEWQLYARQQQRGETILWFNLEGFFWWPRVLLGITGHLYAFYDQPRLIHRINEDQLQYQHRCVDAFCSLCEPDMMNFWEDMSYNHGPMISKNGFDEFIAPYYREIIPYIKKHEIPPFIDSDGQVEPLIPWFEALGLEGIGPLERMAGVDVNRIRRNHPHWKMIGGFDKTVMPLGESAMRAEFERILPVMRSGYYIPTVDHQTPPGVSLDTYRIYRRLQDEYATLAVH